MTRKGLFDIRKSNGMKRGGGGGESAPGGKSVAPKRCGKLRRLPWDEQALGGRWCGDKVLLRLIKMMRSLVLLRREQPVSVYVAEGENGNEVLSRLRHEDCEANVQVLAELPGLCKEPLLAALNEYDKQGGWFSCGPNAVFLALAKAFGGGLCEANEAQDAFKKPCVRLWKADRELIQRMREEMCGTTRAIQEARELPFQDRQRLDAFLNAHKEYEHGMQSMNNNYISLRSQLRDVQNELRNVAEITKTSAQRTGGRGALEEADCCSLFGDSVSPKPRRGKLKHKPAKPCCDRVGEAAPNEGFESDQQPNENQPQPCKEASETDEIAEAAIKSNSEGHVVAHERQKLFSADAEAIEEQRNAAGAKESANEPATSWIPNARLEEVYEDLSDVSSLDGNESPRHKEVKVYARARRVARACVAVTSMPGGAEAFLETCSKEDAESAAAVRQQLVQSFGEERAIGLLAPYRNKVMRGSCGKPQRFFVDASGSPVRVACPKNVAVL